MEMNTRLQVEHPITEWVTGVDLVRWQIEIAQGARLPELLPASRGHAIEARLYAEDPARGFLPCPGRIEQLFPAGGPGVRDDCGVYAGYSVPIYYDPMIGKLSVWAPTREQAIERLRRALAEYLVSGITTNIAWLRRVIDHPEFRSGDYDTGFLERRAEELTERTEPGAREAAAMAAALTAYRSGSRQATSAVEKPHAGRSLWREQGRLKSLRRP
jgi:acetyl-CoA carboxylase biotin carboxylase subunit